MTYQRLNDVDRKTPGVDNSLISLRCGSEDTMRSHHSSYHGSSMRLANDGASWRKITSMRGRNNQKPPDGCLKWGLCEDENPWDPSHTSFNDSSGLNPVIFRCEVIHPASWFEQNKSSKVKTERWIVMKTAKYWILVAVHWVVDRPTQGWSTHPWTGPVYTRAVQTALGRSRLVRASPGHLGQSTHGVVSSF